MKFAQEFYGVKPPPLRNQEKQALAEENVSNDESSRVKISSKKKDDILSLTTTKEEAEALQRQHPSLAEHPKDSIHNLEENKASLKAGPSFQQIETEGQVNQSLSLSKEEEAIVELYRARMRLQTSPVMQKNTRKHQSMVERFGSIVMEAVPGCNENAAAGVLDKEQSHKDNAQAVVLLQQLLPPLLLIHLKEAKEVQQYPTSSSSGTSTMPSSFSTTSNVHNNTLYHIIKVNA